MRMDVCSVFFICVFTFECAGEDSEWDPKTIHLCWRIHGTWSNPIMPKRLQNLIRPSNAFVGRVARFFLTQYTKMVKNKPNNL
jgi:hypothetical protein